MKTYLLDTDICIAFLQGKSNLATQIKRVGVESCYISEITLAELTYGAYCSKQFEKHIAEVVKVKSLFKAIPIYLTPWNYSDRKKQD